jgi:hypothetical protein
MSNDERIRERAFHIWISEGRPSGHDTEHWQRACRQIEREEGAKANGINVVPAANVVVHKGPISSSATFDPTDGLNTPGTALKR